MAQSTENIRYYQSLIQEFQEEVDKLKNLLETSTAAIDDLQQQNQKLMEQNSYQRHLLNMKQFYKTMIGEDDDNTESI